IEDIPAPVAEMLQPEVTELSAKYSVAALLFSDIESFGALSDSEVVYFADKVLPRVADLAKKHDNQIEVKETWGDGLFLAFRSLRTAGIFAIDLSNLMAKIDWQSLG